jgi:hypothetical protein
VDRYYIKEKVETSLTQRLMRVHSEYSNPRGKFLISNLQSWAGIIKNFKFYIKKRIFANIYHHFNNMVSPYDKPFFSARSKAFFQTINRNGAWHGLINYIDTKAKCRHLEKITCKGTLRHVFIRVYRLEIQSVMLVIRPSFVKFCPSNLLSGFNSPPPSLCE